MELEETEISKCYCVFIKADISIMCHWSTEKCSCKSWSESSWFLAHLLNGYCIQGSAESHGRQKRHVLWLQDTYNCRARVRNVKNNNRAWNFPEDNSFVHPEMIWGIQRRKRDLYSGRNEFPSNGIFLSFLLGFWWESWKIRK